MKSLSLFPLALLVAACAEPYTWSNPNASGVDRQRDAYECERDTRAAAASFSGGVFGAGEAQAFYSRCMAARGYSPQRGTVPATAQRDATGRTYVDNDRVMCAFPGVAPVNLQARACAQGGGTITGPA